jgi:hypothetical protein
MRKTKRFTPNLIERYLSLGRGKGTFEEYIPFHRVGRSDPSSLGISHLTNWNNRQRELLSEGEHDSLLFALMLPNLVDVREQMPLSYESSSHELGDYDINTTIECFPGTQQICVELGIKHPRVNGNDRSIPWRMTTDMLLTLKHPNNRNYLLAISCKPLHFNLEGRKRKLLEIEKVYWEKRGVKWLLITPDVYEHSVALTLRRSYQCVIDSEIDKNTLSKYSKTIIQQSGKPLHLILNWLADKVGDMTLAQRIFWQNVWSGHVPIDLRRGWRPHDLVEIISPEDFRGLNPILSGRSAWN